MDEVIWANKDTETRHESPYSYVKDEALDVIIFIPNADYHKYGRFSSLDRRLTAAIHANSNQENKLSAAFHEIANFVNYVNVDVAELPKLLVVDALYLPEIKELLAQKFDDASLSKVPVLLVDDSTSEQRLSECRELANIVGVMPESHIGKPCFPKIINDIYENVTNPDEQVSFQDMIDKKCAAVQRGNVEYQDALNNRYEGLSFHRAHGGVLVPSGFGRLPYNALDAA